MKQLKNTSDIPVEFAEAQRIDFCKEWPCAKRELEILRDIIKMEIVKQIIDIAISAGDTIAGKICKP
jgi:hypothetical protein